MQDAEYSSYYGNNSTVSTTLPTLSETSIPRGPGSKNSVYGWNGLKINSLLFVLNDLYSCLPSVHCGIVWHTMCLIGGDGCSLWSVCQSSPTRPVHFISFHSCFIRLSGYIVRAGLTFQQYKSIEAQLSLAVILISFQEEHVHPARKTT